MRAILSLLGTFVGNLFKSRRRLEIENLFLRHQLNIALRRAPGRQRLCGWSLLGLACVVQPGTILRWHRAGFRACLIARIRADMISENDRGVHHTGSSLSVLPSFAATAAAV